MFYRQAKRILVFMKASKRHAASSTEIFGVAQRTPADRQQPFPNPTPPQTALKAQLFTLTAPQFKHLC